MKLSGNLIYSMKLFRKVVSLKNIYINESNWLNTLQIYTFFFSISNWFTHFYIQQDNIKKLTKKTYKNKQQHKNKTLVTFENVKMRKAKQRCKNSDNIEEVYIQLRFPDHSQLNKLKRGRKKNLNNTKTYGATKKKKKFLFKKVVYQIS